MTLSENTKRLNVYKVGSFYPYYIVAASTEAEAIEVVKRMIDENPNNPNAAGEGAGLTTGGAEEWVVEQLDTSKPGIIEGNAG